MKSKNLFWGLFFLLSGVFIIAGQTGSFGDLGIMSLLATVFLAAIVIYSIFKLNWFGIFIPAAFLYMIYSKPLTLTVISPLILIFSAFFVSIGLSMIFHKHHNIFWCSHDGKSHYSKSNEDIDDNNPYAKVSLSSSSKYLHSDCLKSGHFYCSLGELELYFDQVQLSPEGAEIYLDCSLGSIKLYIPMNWNVVDIISVSLGYVANTKVNLNIKDAPKLTLTGKVSLGNIEVHYL